jgi:GPH family glycoside/pentoside/hexuronide:cation symporter
LLDADLARRGVHREAMFLTAFSFFNRSAAIMQAAAFALAATWFGFRSGDQPGDRAGDAARFMMVGVPTVCVLGAFLMSLTVRIPRSDLNR